MNDLKETSGKFNWLSSNYKFTKYLQICREIAKVDYKQRLKLFGEMQTSVLLDLVGYQLNYVEGYEMGCLKYPSDQFSWQNSNIDVYLNALLRHMHALWVIGDNYDDDDYSHISAILTNLRFIAWHIEDKRTVELIWEDC